MQLCRRFADGTRSAVVTSIPWDATGHTSVLNLIQAVRERMEAQGLGLKEAYDLIGASTGLAAAGSVDWQGVVERYQRFKVHETGQISQSTWDRNYRYRMERALECLSRRPAPPHWSRDPGALPRRLLRSAGFRRPQTAAA
ncbi:MAG: hypothetical protein WBN89_01515 [Prochlorococcaceae cyanobacterium]